MYNLTPDDNYRVNYYLRREHAARQASAQQARRGFFSWLGDVGLGWIVTKLLDLGWMTIRAFFGF